MENTETNTPIKLEQPQGNYENKVANSPATQNSQRHKIFIGNSDEVNRLGYFDYNDYIRNTVRKQKMQGFDESCLDLVDYIIKITHRIWEEKEIGLIYDTYANNITVHSGTITHHGINTIVANTLQSLHAFPDDREVAANVVWSGNNFEGFYSSHRISTTGTNLGESGYGLPTGKKVTYRSVADCFCFNNRIVEEWIVRDGLYLTRQLGINPVEFAKKLAEQANASPPVQATLAIGENMDGQLMPQVYSKEYEHFEIGDFILEMYNKVWDRRLFSSVKGFYLDNATVNFIDGKTLIGFSQIQGAFISLIASFPSSKLIIERVTCNQIGGSGDWDVAVRWKLQGIHEGFGLFGQPSGKPIEILGINHLRVKNEKIVEEWVTFDGMDVLKQIFAA